MYNHFESNNRLSANDHHLIDQEHELLAKFLNDLRDTCANLDNQKGCDACSKEKFASCHGRMYSFLYDLLEISAKHFNHEEMVMLKSATTDSEYFRAHQKDHMKIMSSLKEIVDTCATLDQQGITAEGYRRLYKTISNLFKNHNFSFDEPFIKSTLQ